jgi:hypothetical protein
MAGGTPANPATPALSFCLVQARLDDAVDQARRQRNQRREQPQPPPERAGLSADHLVTAEPAVTVEWPSHASTVPALMQLEAAVAAASILRVIHSVIHHHHHGRLITPRTEAGRNQRQGR